MSDSPIIIMKDITIVARNKTGLHKQNALAFLHCKVCGRAYTKQLMLKNPRACFLLDRTKGLSCSTISAMCPFNMRTSFEFHQKPEYQGLKSTSPPVYSWRASLQIGNFDLGKMARTEIGSSPLRARIDGAYDQEGK